jgi:hypothetical protein
LTSSADALEHPFFSQHSLKPSLADMVLLPSSVIRLIDIIDQVSTLLNFFPSLLTTRPIS